MKYIKYIVFYLVFFGIANQAALGQVSDEYKREMNSSFFLNPEFLLDGEYIGFCPNLSCNIAHIEFALQYIRDSIASDTFELNWLYIIGFRKQQTLYYLDSLLSTGKYNFPSTKVYIGEEFSPFLKSMALSFPNLIEITQKYYDDIWDYNEEWEKFSTKLVPEMLDLPVEKMQLKIKDFEPLFGKFMELKDLTILKYPNWQEDKKEWSFPPNLKVLRLVSFGCIDIALLESVKKLEKIQELSFSFGSAFNSCSSNYFDQLADAVLENKRIKKLTLANSSICVQSNCDYNDYTRLRLSPGKADKKDRDYKSFSFYFDKQEISPDTLQLLSFIIDSLVIDFEKTPNLRVLNLSENVLETVIFKNAKYAKIEYLNFNSTNKRSLVALLKIVLPLKKLKKLCVKGLFSKAEEIDLLKKLLPYCEIES